MICSNDHSFLYPAYDRDSDSFICPTCREIVDMSQIPQEDSRNQALTEDDIPIEDKVKDLQELVKILIRRVERLEKQADISQSSSGESLSKRIRSLFRSWVFD
jgi:hypothetical protein